MRHKAAKQNQSKASPTAIADLWRQFSSLSLFRVLPWPFCFLPLGGADFILNIIKIFSSFVILLYYIVTKKGIFAASRIKKNFIKNYTMLFFNTLNFTKSLSVFTIVAVMIP